MATVFLGGGTPTLLPADVIAELLDLIRERFGVDEQAEISIEGNPGPDERGDAAALARAGVTRISYGAQSLDHLELRRLGRSSFAIRSLVEDIGVSSLYRPETQSGDSLEPPGVPLSWVIGGGYALTIF